MGGKGRNRLVENFQFSTLINSSIHWYDLVDILTIISFIFQNSFASKCIFFCNESSFKFFDERGENFLEFRFEFISYWYFFLVQWSRWYRWLIRYFFLIFTVKRSEESFKNHINIVCRNEENKEDIFSRNEIDGRILLISTDSSIDVWSTWLQIHH